MTARLSTFAAVALIGSLVLGCHSDGPTSSSDPAPPVAPQNLQVTQNASGDVITTWDQNTQSNLRGYNVYRLDVAESSIEKLTSTPIDANYYVDETAVWESEYEYRVTSVSTAGDESVYIGATIQVQTPSNVGKRRPKD